MKRIHYFLLVIAGCLLAAVLFIYMWHTYPTQSLSSWRYYACVYRQTVQAHFLVSAVIFTLVYAATVLSGIPLFFPLTLAAGYLFCFVPGIILVVIGANTGAIASFLLARTVLRHTLERRYKDQLILFKQRIEHSHYAYMLTLHLMMVFPYIIINTLAALGGVSLFTFVWTTLIGSLPLIVVTVFAGKQLEIMTSEKPIIPSSIWIGCLLVAAIIVVLSFLRGRSRSTL
jgi:uncharacterized membrane protein YdjX (TVP38/TMEM64 family)